MALIAKLPGEGSPVGQLQEATLSVLSRFCLLSLCRARPLTQQHRAVCVPAVSCVLVYTLWQQACELDTSAQVCGTTSAAEGPSHEQLKQ